MKVNLNSICLLLLSAFFSVKDIKGQGTGFLLPSACTGSASGTTADSAYYSGQTVYQLLCDQALNDDDVQNPWTSFRKFCNAIDNYSAMKTLLNSTSSRVTVFAPVDGAFDQANLFGQGQDIQRLLDLHVLPTIRSLEDLQCGQTYITVNPMNRSPVQRTRTICDAYAGVGGSFQIGPCNTGGGGNLPRLGSVSGNQVPFTFSCFDTLDDSTANDACGWQPNESKYPNGFNVNAVVCNGIIHTVDSLLLPLGSPNCQQDNRPPASGKNAKGSKGGKKGGKKGGRYYSYYDDDDYYYDFRRDLELMDDNEEEYDDEEDDETEDEAMVTDEIDTTSTERDNRLERRKRVLESLVEPNGDIQPLNQ